jgi:outer membrane usher protein
MAIANAEARAQPEDLPEQFTLILEVRLNGVLSPLLWQFESLPDGSLATSAERLRLLGFDLEHLGVMPHEQLVKLSDLPGVTYNYIAETQSIELDVVAVDLVPVVLDAGNAQVPLDPTRIERNLGAVLNYALFGNVGGAGTSLSGQYELRLLGSWGMLTTSAFGNLGISGPQRTEHVRLDTYWRTVDARRAIVYAAGDVIADGGELGSIYRLGGVQVRRDYGNRPDLVTMAMPIFSGSAAVPSTVDLYVNGLRYFSGETGRGPFQFRSLPNVGGGARATVVLTDAAGRETRIERPIFFAPGLLPRGLLDFSVEAGFPRLRYGINSFDYLPEPAASGSVRYGLTNWLTVRGHAEGMTDFVNGAAGATAGLGGIGTISAEFAASTFQGRVATRYAIDAEAYVAGINFYGGIERTSTHYQDVVRRTDFRANLVHDDELEPVTPVPPGGTAGGPHLLAFSSKTDRVGASFSLFDTGFSFNYTRLRLPKHQLKILGASVSRSLFDRVSVWAHGYRDFGDEDDYGVFVGLSVPLGTNVSASSSYGRSNHNSTLAARVWRDPDGSEGSWGWTLDASETLRGNSDNHRGATVRYLAPFATLEGAVSQFGGDVRATAYAEGAVVAMGGGVFTSRRIDDSFAVVRGAGVDTPVLSNTIVVTRTDESGRALVPFLSSFQENVVSIDPAELPVDLKPARTEAVVVPGDRAGVVIEFGVEQIAAAIVILVDAAGMPLPIGSVVVFEESAEPAVVGFDGRAYLTGLSAHNRIRVRREEGTDCWASFDFVPVEGQQVQIGPLTCQ